MYFHDILYISYFIYILYKTCNILYLCIYEMLKYYIKMIGTKYSKIQTFVNSG